MLDISKVVLITEDSDIQPAGSLFELEDLSINIPKSYTIWLGNLSPELEQLVLSNSIKVVSNGSNIITEIDTNSNIITDTTTTYTTSGIQLLFESDTQSIETTEIQLYHNTTLLLSFSLRQRYIDLQDRLYVAANNYGIQINEDWNKAFIESDIHEDNPDYILHNRKLSEFLLHLFELIGLRGSYKTFLTAINYFGYADMLWFEETWINKNGQRQLTDINNQLIDEHFSRDGYTKIGELIMFYSLDKLEDEEPYDEGGLPQYEYRNISYKDLYTKLVILRKILSQWFIPYDVHITGIIGEFHGVMGQQKKVWTAEDTFLMVDEHSRFDFIDVTWDGTHLDEDGNKRVLITERKFIANTNLYSIIDDKLVLNQSDTAHLKQSLIQIEKIDEEIVDLQDFDILTKFFVQDVAVLNQKITIHTPIPEYILGFKLRLVKISSNSKHEVVYLSKMISVDEIHNINRLGIRLLGNFEISITAFDWYGYSKSWSEKFTITSENIAFDFLTLRPKYINNDSEYWKRFTHFETVQNTNDIDGVPIIDAVSYPNWDINNPDIIAPGTRIARKYFHVGDRIIQPVIRNKRNINISQLNKIPISENWNPFNIAYVRLGDRFKISLKLFPHYEWEELEFINESQFLNDITLLSKNANSCFSLFDFDIQLLNSVYDKRLYADELEKSFKVLVIFDKLKALTLDSVIFKFEVDGEEYTNDNGIYDNPIINIRSLDEDVIFHNKIYPSFGYDPMIRFNYILPINTNSISDTMDYRIRMTIGTVEFVSDEEYGLTTQMFNFGTLKNILKNILPEELYNELDIYFSYNTFTIRHRYGQYIEMSHIALGHKLASKRIGSINKLYHTVAGSSFQIGSMIILMPNEDIKINTQDVTWTITDTFNKYKYLTSKSYVCKWVPYREGIYDVECTTTDLITNQRITMFKKACILVE